MQSFYTFYLFSFPFNLSGLECVRGDAFFCELGLTSDCAGLHKIKFLKGVPAQHVSTQRRVCKQRTVFLIPKMCFLCFLPEAG